MDAEKFASVCKHLVECEDEQLFRFLDKAKSIASEDWQVDTFQGIVLRRKLNLIDWFEQLPEVK